MNATWMVRLGTGGSNVNELVDAGYLGVDFVGSTDIRSHLGKGAEAFRKAVSPIFLQRNPDATKVVAGRAAGSLHYVCEVMQEGDLVLVPTYEDRSLHSYHYGVVASGYEYRAGEVLPHRRRVDWRGSFNRSSMSPELAAATSQRVTVIKLGEEHAAELAELTHIEHGDRARGADLLPAIVQEQAAFQLEKQLEEFLVHNWENTVLGKDYDIYEAGGETIGQQYMTTTGPMDILAISKDKSRLLVVELKKGRASDSVVGQIQRYMGYVQSELAEPGQTVEGVIIAQEEDERIRLALSVAQRIEFLKYRVEFYLER